MKSLQLILRGIAATAVLSLAIGCTPPAETDTSTDTSAAPAASDTVADSNTTAAAETPAEETPATEEAETPESEE